MTFSFSSALKRIALVAAFSRLSKPGPVSREEVSPQPRRRICLSGGLDDVLFDVNRTEFEDRVGALSLEMDRLSGSFARVRGLLSVISADAPLRDEVVATPEYAAIHEDSLLFEGEPAFAGESVVPLGDVSELFEESIVIPGPRIGAEVGVSRAA